MSGTDAGEVARLEELDKALGKVMDKRKDWKMGNQYKLGWGAGLFLTLLAGFVSGGSTELLREDGWSLMRPGEGDATLDVSAVSTAPVAVGDGGGHTGPILRLAIHKPADPFWRILVGQTLVSPVAADHRIHLSFQARSATHNPLRAVIEVAGAPYTCLAEQLPTLGSDWAPYEAVMVSTGYPASGLAVRFQAGQQSGVVELRDIHLEDLGVDPDMVAARAAVEPAAVAARIERIRKREVRIAISDAGGRPAAGARVTVTQTRHAFWFGCNFFALEPGNQDPLQQAYQQRLAGLFNYATLPFYWGAYEPASGKTGEARLMGMAQWCAEHRIVTKGHPLVWHEVYPAWAPADAETAIPMLRARVTKLLNQYRGKIDVWDVVNEANGSAFRQNNGVGAWARRDGAAAMVGTALDWARAARPEPGATFIYNDYDIGPANVGLLQALRTQGKLPDAIGLQSHMHDKEWKLEWIWLTAERFAAFGRPLHFTEVTVLSGEHRPIPNAPGPRATDWKSTAEGEAAQAEYLGRFYSILFSHPQLRAITYWDLSDRDAWLGAPAGLLHKDMTPKPAYDRLMDLIHRQWWTKAVETTDAKGVCTLRAFCGDYEITVTDVAGKVTKATAMVSPDTATTEVTVRIP